MKKILLMLTVFSMQVSLQGFDIVDRVASGSGDDIGKSGLLNESALKDLETAKDTWQQARKSAIEALTKAGVRDYELIYCVNGKSIAGQSKQDACNAYKSAIGTARKAYDDAILRAKKALGESLTNKANKYVCVLYGNLSGNGFRVNSSGDWYAVAYVNSNAACSWLWSALGGSANHGAYILAKKPADLTKLPTLGSKYYPEESERTGCGNCGETLKSNEKAACNQSCATFE